VRHSADTLKEVAAELLKADAAGTARVVPSERLPGLNLTQALELQRTYLAARRQHGTRLAGAKAGMTSAPVQQRFGLSEPVLGGLYGEGMVPSGAVIEAGRHRGLLIETEIGFRLARPLTAAPADRDELKAAIAACLPVVELAEPGFAAAFSGVDVVAANVIAWGCVLGEERALDDGDLDAVEVSLGRDGETLHRGSAAEVLDGQWSALRWLIAAALDRGLPLDAGSLLITGAIGPAQPGQPGTYRAGYGTFGEVAFTLAS